MNTHRPLTAIRRLQRGVTMIESLIVLTIATVSLGAALPSFEQARQRRHFDGIAAQLETDIFLARSEAVTRNRSMRISFKADDDGSCYVVHSGPADACSCSADGAARCEPGQFAVRSVRLAAAGAVQLQSNVPSILFDAVRGTSTPTGTIRLVGQDRRAVHVVVNIMGRVRSCSPGGSVPGYKVC